MEIFFLIVNKELQLLRNQLCCHGVAEFLKILENDRQYFIDCKQIAPCFDFLLFLKDFYKMFAFLSDYNLQMIFLFFRIDTYS